MAALDSKARATAQKVLDKLGKTATYKQVSNTYDRVSGSNTQTSTEYDVKIYIDKPTTGEIQAGLVTATDAIILIAAKALTVTPKAGDAVIADITYYVKNNMPIWSGGEIALHRLVVSVA